MTERPRSAPPAAPPAGTGPRTAPRLQLSIDSIRVRGYDVTEPGTLGDRIRVRLDQLVARHGVPAAPSLPGREPIRPASAPVDDGQLADQIASAIWSRLGGAT